MVMVIKLPRDFCYPRIEKLLKDIKLKGEQVEGLDGNLKYFNCFVDYDSRQIKIKLNLPNRLQRCFVLKKALLIKL